MEKGKKPIEEEGNGSSSLKNYQPINLASSSSEPPLKFETAFEQSDSDSAEGAVVLDEMEETVDADDDDDDDCFSKSSTTGYLTDSPAAAGTSKSLVASSSNPAANITDDALALPAQLASSSMAKPFEYRKPLSPQELENIAKTNPKRAKRIIINRRSAVRAKERKKLYTCTLEHQFQKFKSQAARASAQFTLLGTEHKSLIYENSKLKDHTKFAKQMIELQESKNDDMRKEIQFYEHFLARQMCAAVGGNMMINLRSSSSAPSVNDPSMAARQGLTLQSRSIHHVYPGLQRAGQHPNQARHQPQPQPQQHRHQNYYPMRNNAQVWPRRHLRE